VLVFRTHRDVGYSTVRSARFAPPLLARSLSPYPRLLPFTGRAHSPSLFVLSQEGPRRSPRGEVPPPSSSGPLLRRGAVSHCRLSLLFHIASGATMRYVNVGRGKLKVAPRNVASATFQSLRKLRDLDTGIEISVTLISDI